jgi:hypothetical protein
MMATVRVGKLPAFIGDGSAIADVIDRKMKGM